MDLSRITKFCTGFQLLTIFYRHSSKILISGVIMQLSTVVLKEDDSLLYANFGQVPVTGLIVNVKSLLSDYKGFFYACWGFCMVKRLCPVLLSFGHTLEIRTLVSSTTANIRMPRNTSLFFCRACTVVPSLSIDADIRTSTIKVRL